MNAVRAFFFTLLFLFCGRAEAACISPAGVLGELKWIPANSDFEVCNGTTWSSTFASKTAVSCTNAGELQYMSGPLDMRYCDGSYWNSTLSTLSNGVCAGFPAGTVRYNSTSAWEEFCDGTSWQVMVVQPTLAMNFAAGALSNVMHFENSGTPPRYFNSAGTLVSAAANLVQYSERLNTAPWSMAGSITATEANAPAPDGSNNATLLSTTSSAGAYFANQPVSIPNDSLSRTFSVFLKPGTTTASTVKVQFLKAGSPTTFHHAQVSWATPSISSCTSTCTITPAGGGWYRISVVAPNDSSGNDTASLQVWGSMYQVSTAYAWGAQFEVGTSPSLPIYTTNSIGNGPRLDYDPTTLAARGLLIEEGRTNSIRNNSMVGATTAAGGTLPTYWSLNVPTGVTKSIVAVGTENGIPYFDLQVTGTNTSGSISYSVLAFDSNTAASATAGQKWATSLFAKTISGSAPGGFSLYNYFYDSGGTYLSNQIVASLTSLSTSGLATQRFSGTITTPTNTASVLPGLAFNLNAGDTINVTIRIGTPQLELGSFATSPIFTIGSAQTRGKDFAAIYLANSSWYNSSAGTVAAQINVPVLNQVTNQFFFDLDDGTGSNRMGMRTAVSSSTIWSETVLGGSMQGLAYTFGSAAAINTNITGALAYGPTFAGSVNGQAVLSDAKTIPPVTQLQIGSYGGANQQTNGWVRFVRYYNSRLSNTQVQHLSATGQP